MQLFRHTSNDNDCWFEHYFYNIPETEDSLHKLIRDALEQYRFECASKTLHEIAHGIFGSGNPEETARVYSCAPAMLKLLKRIASDKEICFMREIHRLLDYVEGKEVD